MAEKKEPKNSQARIDANNRYAAKAYDRLSIVLPKGQKNVVEEHAKKAGESLNSYIVKAINAQMENDK